MVEELGHEHVQGSDRSSPDRPLTARCHKPMIVSVSSQVAEFLWPLPTTWSRRSDTGPSTACSGCNGPLRALGERIGSPPLFDSSDVPVEPGNVPRQLRSPTLIPN